MASCIHYNHRPHINSISDLTDHLSELSSHALILYRLVYAVYGYYHLSHVLSLRPYIMYAYVITTGRAFRDGFSTQQPSQSAQCLNGCGFFKQTITKGRHNECLNYSWS